MGSLLKIMYLRGRLADFFTTIQLFLQVKYQIIHGIVFMI